MDWIASARSAAVACASIKPLAGPSMGTNSKLTFCAMVIITCRNLALAPRLTSHTLLPAAWAAEIGGFIECVRGPGIEHGGEQHLVLEGRAGGCLDGLEVCSGSGTTLPQTTIWYPLLMLVNSPVREFRSETQFKAECKPPAPARKSMLAGSPASSARQFHKQAPQKMHFSRSNCGTPLSPRVIACPEHISTQSFGSQLRQTSGRRNAT